MSGTVHDPSGIGVSNATISITSQAADTMDMTTTGREGNFSFKALHTGEYELKVLKTGFKEYRALHVSMEPGRDYSRDITLEIAAIVDEVNVVSEVGSKAMPSSEAQAEPSRVLQGGDIQAAKLINKIQPVYPAAAKAAGIQGTVILHAVVGMDGTPLSLRVMNSQVDPELSRAAIEAVSKWRYTPTLLNGQPVEVDTTIVVNFKLSA